MLTYILLFNFVFFNSPLSELGKLPVLFNHLKEHQERDRSTGFLDFLSMHYWGKDINDHDEDRDRQLPFKQINTTVIQVFAFSNPPLTIAYQKLNCVKVSYPLIDDHRLPQSFISTLFRPPQV